MLGFDFLYLKKKTKNLNYWAKSPVSPPSELEQAESSI